METVRTVVCKLDPTPEQRAEIDATLKAFALGCDFAADVAHRIGSTNKVRVQAEGYREIRSTFGLSANLAIRAIARACAALKVPEQMHSTFAPTSIDYDARIFSFREWDWTFSLTMLHSRQRIATRLGDRQKAMLKGRKPTSAVLSRNRNGGYFLHVQIVDEAPEPHVATDFIGVDMGIANIAVDSDGEKHTGKSVEVVRRRHNLQRKRLQRKGTKGAKKKLKRVAGKEARFRKHENHVISKAIVGSAEGTGRGIAVEDLDGIRDRLPAWARDARNKLSGWSFFQLFSFLAYKAQSAGVPIVKVDARNTSRTCAECGHCCKENRTSQEKFLCVSCGHAANADVNAARNIRARAVPCNAAPGLVGTRGNGCPDFQPNRKAAGF